MRARSIAAVLATFLCSAAYIDCEAAIPLSERNALLALYDSTGGSGWTTKSGWGGAAGGECSWYGVSCDATQGTVVSLDLTANKLAGSIPSSLSDLSALRALRLGENDISGNIPASLGSLSLLEYLELNGNAFYGAIPTELGNLSNLEMLILSGNELSGSIPASLGNLGSLWELDLSANALTGAVPPSLGNIAGLRYLHLSDNALTGAIPSQLGSLGNLVMLELGMNKLSGAIPATLGGLTNLELLDFAENNLSGPLPASLGGLTKLRYLDGSWSGVSGELPAELGNLAALEWLGLSHNDLEGPVPPTFGNLAALDGLLLDSNRLEGDLPSSLAALGNVCVGCLDLDYNALYASDAGVASWAAARAPGWNYTQTVAPSSVWGFTSGPNSLSLWWYAIEFTDFSGRYEIWVDQGQGEYLAESTLDKLDRFTNVTGLSPGKACSIRVRTVTSPHALNHNEVVSGFSNTVVLTPSTAPAVNMTNGGMTEGDGRNSRGAFMYLDDPWDQPVSVDVVLLSGSATVGVDFEAPSRQTVTFPAGKTTAYAEMTIVGDKLDEDNETILFKLVDPVNGTVGYPFGEITIMDDDDAPRLSVADVSVIEGKSASAQTVVVPLNLVGGSELSSSLTWATAEGPAKSGSDYTSAGGTITIPPGGTPAPLRIEVFGDDEYEGNEHFYVNLSASSTLVLSDPQFRVTILDDDQPELPAPDPVIAVSGCARVGDPCTLTAASASGASTSTWVVAWKLGGKPAGATTVWSPTFETSGTYSVALKATNATGSADAYATLVVEQNGDPRCPANTLCLLGGRFEVTLAAVDPRSGATGAGVRLEQNDVFGSFSIPALTANAANPEVFVKMLDGRSITGSFWVFYGGLTDFEYTLTVRDTVADSARTYRRAGGTSAGGFDVGSGVAPESCPNELDGLARPPQPPSPCEPGSDHLCLGGSRFRVELSARDQRTGATAPGEVLSETNLVGYFALPALTANRENPEVFVKILDGRSVNGFWWVFYGGLTDLEYELTVIDSVTGATMSYSKAAGSACGAYDVSAF